MDIAKITLRRMKLKLRYPFITSFGVHADKDFSIIEITDKDGLTGYGECAALFRPWYNEEFADGAVAITREFLIPALLEAKTIKTPEEFFDSTSWIRRNRMARASVDCALWDLYSKEQGIPEYKALGGVRTKVEGGVSIGMQDSPDALLKKVDQYMKEGYRRVKCKIEPGKDVAYMAAVRREFGNIPLTCDANSAYTLKDIEIFKELDDLNLLMIEQPLTSSDIIDHSHLQAAIKTPICLDESIESPDDMRYAIGLKSCKILNIKVSRVGGLTEARRLQQYAGEHGIHSWCGDMLDTGIQRAHNIASATLPYYTWPNDIVSSDQYFANNLVADKDYVDSESYVKVSEKPGLGYTIDQKQLDTYTVQKWEYTTD